MSSHFTGWKHHLDGEVCSLSTRLGWALACRVECLDICWQDCKHFFLLCEFQRFEKNRIENKYFMYIESLYSQINISWFDPYFEYSIPCKSDWLSLSLSYLVRYDVTLESVKNVATMSTAPLCFLSHLGCDSCNAVLRACRYLLGFCIKSQANTWYHQAYRDPPTPWILSNNLNTNN